MDVPEGNAAKTTCGMSVKRQPDQKNLGAMLAEEKHSDKGTSGLPGGVQAAGRGERNLQSLGAW